ncbi:hypothetical protein RND81_04G180200 [Saponaria officinalis]|uniref:Uncharacterized protein n=1 Tax=Saponaria officinalis TaxID=3572 RepID=A0AAW1LNB5_SAPOF
MSPSPLRRMRNSINRALLIIFKNMQNHYKEVKRNEDIKSSQILSIIPSSNKHYKIVPPTQGSSNQIQASKRDSSQRDPLKKLKSNKRASKTEDAYLLQQSRIKGYIKIVYANSD